MCSRRLMLPEFHDNQHVKVVSLSALRTDRLYPPGNIPDTHFCQRLSQPQSHSAAGRIMSMKNYNGNIGNRTRDLSVCSALPQIVWNVHAWIWREGHWSDYSWLEKIDALGDKLVLVPLCCPRTYFYGIIEQNACWGTCSFGDTTTCPPWVVVESSY